MQKGFLGPAPTAKPGQPANPPTPPKAEPEVPKALKDRGDDNQQVRAPRANLQVSDFFLSTELGEGSFSQVVKAKRKGTDEWYALKIMNKKFILRERKAEYVKNERSILDKLTYDGIVRLCFTFQDTVSLYLGMELCTKGELFTQIKRKVKFPEEDAKFYAGEIVLILEYIHSFGVIHRDLKPENLLLSDECHLKLCDFGSAKQFADADEAIGADIKDGRKSTFVGTAEYVAPEVLNGNKLTNSVDLWALGCCLYQLVVGKPPFRGETEYLTFQKVLAVEMAPVPAHVSETCKDLIMKLLAAEGPDRLGAGAGGSAAIKAHPFFAGLDFATLRNQEPPEFMPHPNAEETSAPKTGAQQLGEQFSDMDLRDPSKCPQASPSGRGLDIPDPTWMEYVDEGEKIVYTSRVKKYRHMFSKTRQLILTDRPRLFYVDAEAKKVMGDVPWDSKNILHEKTTTKFTVVTPGRDYVFEDLNGGGSKKWKEMITQQLKRTPAS